jgi:hypothetical protein
MKKVLSGRFDRVIYTPTIALVQDFKTGWSEPDPAEQNAQMKVLAVLVALHMPRTVKEVIVQIISGPYGVSEARYDRAALAKAWDEIVGTLRAIQAPNAPLTPGVEQCRYCPAISCCPAVKALAPKTQEAEALPEGEQGALLLDSCDILQKRIDAIREYYAERLSSDPEFNLPGYGMVPGIFRREIKSENWEAARMRLGEWLDLTEIEAASNYRLGDLEKAFGKKLKIKGRELKDRFNTLLQGLIEEKQNGASLKRVSGKAKLALEAT